MRSWKKIAKSFADSRLISGQYQSKWGREEMNAQGAIGEMYRMKQRDMKIIAKKWFYS